MVSTLPAAPEAEACQLRRNCHVVVLTRRYRTPGCGSPDSGISSVVDPVNTAGFLGSILPATWIPTPPSDRSVEREAVSPRSRRRRRPDGTPRARR